MKSVKKTVRGTVFSDARFRALGWQGQKGEIVGQDEGLRTVPARTVEDEEDQKMIRGIIFPTQDGMGAGSDACREISARWAFIAAVLTTGRTSPAATPRAGQIAPNR